MDKIEYKKIAYLLGCYMVIVDKEINQMEVDVLDNYLPLSKEDELYHQRMQIFSDDEERTKLKDILDKLVMANYSVAQKTEIVTLLARIAYGDDYMASSELELLMKVGKLLKLDIEQIIEETHSESNKRITSSQLSSLKRFVGKMENTIYQSFANSDKKSVVDMMLGGLGYSASIAQITEDAEKDLARVTRIIDDLNGMLNEEYNHLATIKPSSKKVSKEVLKIEQIIQGIRGSFNEIIDNSLTSNREVLDKKRRNIRYFTIAFMGRTKAGKSTLHKVITQQENDDIGVGKLRTTRYNRSWYWNKLRIVDTPGIGAPGGEADTEIAKSIIDEADVVCYVVTSDSIQETEFDFFSTIKERNKPLYIILNVKSNLNQAIRLKRFIANPNDWRLGDGPQSIKGHIERIHDKLDGKYNMDAVRIIPIHLLAAQIALSGEQDSKTSKILFEASNISEFTNSVKKEVQLSGSLKKSLSVIDGTSYQINTIWHKIYADLKSLKEGNEVLKKKQSKNYTFFKNELTQVEQYLKTIFQVTRNDLHNRASAFAREHYDDEDAGKAWSKDMVVKSINKRLEQQIQERFNDLNEKIKSELEEMIMDMRISLATNNIGSNVSGESVTNTRLAANVFVSVISATLFVWNPLGWSVAVLAVVGIIGSFLSSLFTSKSEKIRKATDKLRKQLYDSIDSGIDKNLKQVLENTRKSINDTYKSIDSVLKAYTKNADDIITDMDRLVKQVQEKENAINSLVSLRILDFVGKNPVKEISINEMGNQVLCDEYPVERDWQKQSIKFLYNTGLTDKNIQKIEKATQMTIKIK
ncbi:GTPase [uncultured Prevotella sp.]|uniref:GTPase n=1 Tax=uncultured Prevotella sp. TaxID=159272 RepID=UPI0025ED783D|nr:GTPase [uncultured Prevotella sp.]